MSDTASKSFSKEEVSAHNKDGDLWIIIDQEVYNVSKFQDEHPGGKKVLLGVAGSDGSKKFHKYHGPNIMKRYKGELFLGTLEVTQEKKKSLFGFLKRS
ncbi:Acyl-CoA [Onygenales sp. PD_10]|nr:Acyl-CoA [Onygenales sp. PD_10]